MTSVQWRRSVWAPLGWLGLVLVAGCCRGPSGRGAAGGKLVMFDIAWKYQGEGPANSGALGHAVLTPAVAIVDGAVLDPATGQVRWTTPSPVVGVDGGAAIVVRRDGDRYTAIERRDPATGTVTGEAALATADGTARPLRSFGAGLRLVPGRLVYGYLGRFQAYALDSGHEAWTAQLPGTSSTAVSSGELVGLVGADALVVVAAADGVERWRAPIAGVDVDVVASPRGGFFVPRGEQVVELDAAGAEVRSTRGRFSAAHGELLVVTVGADIAVIDGRGREVDRIKPAGAGDFVTAPGLCADAVVYFRSHGTTVWWHPASGAERPVVKIEPKSGTVHGAPVTAGATLTEPPRCLGALVLVQDWFVTAYRIPTP